MTFVGGAKYAFGLSLAWQVQGGLLHEQVNSKSSILLPYILPLCCPTFVSVNNLVCLFDWSVWVIWCVGFIVSCYPQSFNVLVGTL